MVIKESLLSAIFNKHSLTSEFIKQLSGESLYRCISIDKLRSRNVNLPDYAKRKCSLLSDYLVNSKTNTIFKHLWSKIFITQDPDFQFRKNERLILINLSTKSVFINGQLIDAAEDIPNISAVVKAQRQFLITSAKLTECSTAKIALERIVIEKWNKIRSKNVTKRINAEILQDAWHKMNGFLLDLPSLQYKKLEMDFCQADIIAYDMFLEFLADDTKTSDDYFNYIEREEGNELKFREEWKTLPQKFSNKQVVIRENLKIFIMKMKMIGELTLHNPNQNPDILQHNKALLDSKIQYIETKYEEIRLKADEKSLQSFLVKFKDKYKDEEYVLSQQIENLNRKIDGLIQKSQDYRKLAEEIEMDNPKTGRSGAIANFQEVIIFYDECIIRLKLEN